MISGFVVPVRTDIRCAIMRPPITANPVHRAWPITPPTMMPYTLSRAAKMIVVNCERSPHSARNVIEKACTRTRIKMVWRVIFGLRFGTGMVAFTSICGSSTTVITAFSTSGSSVVEVADSFSNWTRVRAGCRREWLNKTNHVNASTQPLHSYLANVYRFSFASNVKSPGKTLIAHNLVHYNMPKFAY